MEQGNDMSIAVTDDSLYSNLDDATVRRMKNRERQRRYRARKRLETDTTNEITYPFKRHESDTNNMKMLVPIPQEVYYASPSNNGTNELPVVETTPKPNIGSRVLSRRDWKNDARRAHTDEQDNRRFSFVIMENVPLDNNGQSSLSISEMQKSGPGRRHWKTEARNKS